MQKKTVDVLLPISGPESSADLLLEFASLIALQANCFRDLSATEWKAWPSALREEERIHDANAGAQAVMSHMGTPGTDGRRFYPNVFRARISGGWSGQDVVNLAGTGCPVGGRIKLGGLRLAVPCVKGNKAMGLNESAECVGVKSGLTDMEWSAADSTTDKRGVRSELSLKVPGHDESSSLGYALDGTTELVQDALSLVLESLLVTSEIARMLVAVEEFNPTGRRLNLQPKDPPRHHFLMSHPGRRVLGMNEGHNAVGSSSCARMNNGPSIGARLRTSGPMRFLQHDSIVRIRRRSKILLELLPHQRGQGAHVE